MKENTEIRTMAAAFKAIEQLLNEVAVLKEKVSKLEAGK